MFIWLKKRKLHSRQSDGRENSFFLFSSFSSVRFHALDTFCKPSRELNEAADGRLGRNVTRESTVCNLVNFRTFLAAVAIRHFPNEPRPRRR
jgi:hypothetical protein